MTKAAYLSASPYWDFNQQATVWKGRIVDEKLFAMMMGKITTLNDYMRSVGLWNAIWLAATFILISSKYAKDMIMLMLGIFACMATSITPLLGPCCCSTPWDGPAMFFATLIFFAWSFGRIWQLILAIALGSIFKESLCIFAIILLFFYQKIHIRHRILFVLECAALCIIARMIITSIALGHIQLNTSEMVHTDGLAIVDHIKQLFHWQHSFLFVNAGLMFVILFTKNTIGFYDTGIKSIIALFWIGQLIGGGEPDEGREYLELIPMIVIYLKEKYV